MSKKEQQPIVEVNWLKIILILCGLAIGFGLAIKFLKF